MSARLQIECISPEHEPLVRELMRETGPALPTWCIEVYVGGPFHRATVGYPLASSRVDADYGRMCIFLGSEFFTQSRREQARVFLHEVCHSHTTPVFYPFRDHCDSQKMDGEHSHACRWLEFGTSHLENTMWRMLGLDVKYDGQAPPDDMSLRQRISLVIGDYAAAQITEKMPDSADGIALRRIAEELDR